MHNTTSTLVLSGVYFLLDRVQVWFHLPFWPVYVVALFIAIWIGRCLTRVIHERNAAR